MLLAFYKPFGILSQFTSDAAQNRTLAEFGFPPNVYPVGRLDADSEGFLLLSDEARIVKYLLEPKYAHPRRYWVQVEGIPTEQDVARLSGGVRVQDYTTRPCKAWHLAEQETERLPERLPPIRVRKNIPASWIALEISEGKNRQVRRMTAACGFPTLRLVRVQIGALFLPLSDENSKLRCGVWRELSEEERNLVLGMMSK
ncbi:MAG: pseudouridine synthase [Candidatus Kapaibacterium sp.]|nr:MAG: pseudouridine synthase [Candidatus Kapabacteria bacterium]